MHPATVGLDEEARIVYQHNNLIRTNLKMGELEAKIFVLALRSVYQSADPKEPLPPIRMRISEVIKGTPNGKSYAMLRQACKDLFDQELHLVSVKSKSKKADYWSRIVTDIGIDEGTGLISGYFNPRIQPFLQGLSNAAGGEGKFTSAYLAKLLTLNNPHSQRMYWILKSWERYDKGPIEYTVDRLKFFLFEVGATDKSGNPKYAKDPYPLWADFYRFVLKQVEKELAKIDFPITITPIKTGKKVTAVRFTLPPVDDTKQTATQGTFAFVEPVVAPLAIASKTAPPKFEQLFARLADYWLLAPWQVELVRETVGEHEVKLEKVRGVMSRVNADKATMDNPAAVLWTNLKKEFAPLRQLQTKHFPTKG